MGHKSCGRDYELTTYYKLPEYLRHNQYVLHGYRSNLSILQTAKSIFHIHNESCNVWTHLLGFILFFFLSFWAHSTWLNHAGANGWDSLVFLIFSVSAQTQMLFSTIFHLFCCVSPQLYDLTAKMDYTGISVLIVGSYFAPMYYIFHAHPNVGLFYLSCIIALGALSIYSVWSSTMHHAGYEVLRLGVFVGLGFFGVLPLPHAVYLNSWEDAWPFIWRLAFMGSLYIGGAAIYLFKFPERFWPGKFDIWFQSHAIWHCFVLAGAYAHYLSIVEFHLLRKGIVA